MRKKCDFEAEGALDEKKCDFEAEGASDGKIEQLLFCSCKIWIQNPRHASGCIVIDENTQYAF